MDNFFSLVTREFTARSAQIRHLVRSHGPSIGAGHEVLLRSFLRDYLPEWIGVAHGFVRDHEGVISGQTDILLHNSVYYAPLYRIDDFAVLQPEAVVGCIEVKTTITKREFVKAIDRLVGLKRMVPDAWVGMFIFHPPSLGVVKRYLDNYNFEQASENDIPDFICGLSKYYLTKENVVSEAHKALDDPYASDVAYMEHVYRTEQSGQDYTFEVFFYDFYRRAESRINKDIEQGIDNVWQVHQSASEATPVLRPRGRLRYSGLALETVNFISVLKRYDRSRVESSRPHNTSTPRDADSE